MKTKKLILVIILLLLSSWVNGQLSDYNKEYIVVNPHYNKAVCGLRDGNIVFAWRSGHPNILSKTFIKEDNKFITNHAVIGGSNYTTEMAPLSNGGFVMSWISSTLYADGKNAGNCRLFNSTGKSVGDEFEVFRSDGLPAKITELSEDGFVVAWEENKKIFYREYNNSGTALSQKKKANNSILDQESPNICKLNNGGYLITWIGDTDSVYWRSSFNVYGQVFNTSGEMVGSEILLSEKYWRGYKISSMKNGGFAFVWKKAKNWDIENDTSGFKCQIYNEQGEKIGNEINVANYIDYYNDDIDICELDSGGFAIVWTSQSGINSEYNIFCSLFSEKGEKLGKVFQVNDSRVRDNCSPIITPLSDNEFLISWSYDQGLYTKKYSQIEKVHNLVPFNQIEPQDNITIMPSKPLFSWESATNEDVSFPWELYYDLYIANNIEFNNSLIINDISDTTHQLVWWLEPDNTYYWKVIAKNIESDSLCTNGIRSFFVDPNIVGLPNEISEIPNNFSLSQNYPNPFNPSTTINYSLPISSKVVLKVYDILGNEITTLINKQQSAGSYNVEFTSSDNRKGVKSGIYFYRISTNNFTKTNKMILLR